MTAFTLSNGDSSTSRAVGTRLASQTAIAEPRLLPMMHSKGRSSVAVAVEIDAWILKASLLVLCSQADPLDFPNPR